MPPIPTAPNLAVGSKTNGWIILEVLDAVKGLYIVGKEDINDISSALEALKLRMVTAENLLNKQKAIRLYRSPTGTDVFEEGTAWEDLSFSETFPLKYITINPGVWINQNAIQLKCIRIYVRSTNASYPSCRNIRFLDGKGAIIPYNNWVVGERSAGFYAPAKGSIYTGAGSQEPPNKSTGWFELEPSSVLDLSRGFTGGWASLRPDTPVTGIDKIEMYFNSGAMKSYTCAGVYSGDKQFLSLPAPEAFQYGSAVAAAQGEMLTAAKLSDPNNNDYGRISGAAFVSAFNTLIASFNSRLNAIEHPAVLALSIETGSPVADQSTATITPPSGKTFTAGGLFWMLNRIAPDNAAISQGTGGTDNVNYATPTTPGVYQLILQPTYLDGSTGDIRENFTIQ